MLLGVGVGEGWKCESGLIDGVSVSVRFDISASIGVSVSLGVSVSIGVSVSGDVISRFHVGVKFGVNVRGGVNVSALVIDSVSVSLSLFMVAYSNEHFALVVKSSLH